MQVSVYGEGDAGVQWGVRVGVDASVDFSELFPDIIASILDDIGLDLTASHSAGIRILGHTDGKVNFVFEFNDNVSEFSFECLDDEDCDAEAERTGLPQYCNDPRDGTDQAPADFLTCRGKKENGEVCTTDSSCLSGDCSFLRIC